MSTIKLERARALAKIAREATLDLDDMQQCFTILMIVER